MELPDDLKQQMDAAFDTLRKAYPMATVSIEVCWTYYGHDKHETIETFACIQHPTNELPGPVAGKHGLTPAHAAAAAIAEMAEMQVKQQRVNRKAELLKELDAIEQSDLAKAQAEIEELNLESQ
jgi:hypothetical protein